MLSTCWILWDVLYANWLLIVIEFALVSVPCLELRFQVVRVVIDTELVKPSFSASVREIHLFSLPGRLCRNISHGIGTLNFRLESYYSHEISLLTLCFSGF